MDVYYKMGYKKIWLKLRNLHGIKKDYLLKFPYNGISLLKYQSI